jgi:biotin-(acetyl-CoA carboxylase) ligase
MGDECNCEKCQANSVIEQGASVWPVVKAEAQVEGRGRSQRNLYLVVTEGGISLRQQSYEI